MIWIRFIEKYQKNAGCRGCRSCPENIQSFEKKVSKELFPEEKAPKSSSSSRKTVISSEEKSKESLRIYSHSVAHTHKLLKTDQETKIEQIEIGEKLIRMQREIISDLDSRVPENDDEAEEIRMELEKARGLIKEFQKHITQLGSDIMLNR